MKKQRRIVGFRKNMNGKSHPITASTNRRRSAVAPFKKRLKVEPNRIAVLRRHLRKIQEQINSGNYERDDYPDLVAEEEKLQFELDKLVPPKPKKHEPEYECSWLDGRKATHYYFPNIDSNVREFVCLEHRRRAEESGFVTYPISDLAPLTGKYQLDFEEHPEKQAIIEDARCSKCGGFLINEAHVNEGEYFIERGSKKPLCISCAEKLDKKGAKIDTISVKVTPNKPKGGRQEKCQQCHSRLATCECLDCGKQVCEECFDDYHGQHCQKRKSPKKFGGDKGVDADFKPQKPAEDEGPVMPIKSKKSRKGKKK